MILCLKKRVGELGDAMESNREPFSVGEIQCVAISDGTFSYPTGWFFSDVPPEQLEGSLRDHGLPLNQVLSPYTCLLVNTGREKILIDTGADGLAPTTGDLLKNLKAEGITREEITIVVLTQAATHRSPMLATSCQERSGISGLHVPIYAAWRWTTT